jgi:ABC-type transporter Mla MlaB component
MDLLRIYQTEPRGFRLVGELDLSCLDLLKPVEEAASAGGDIHLDLTRLTFVDGAGLDRLTSLARILAGSSNRLVTLRPQRAIERLLKRMAAVQKLDNLVISRLSKMVEDSFEAPDLPRDLSRVMVSDYTPEGACKLLAELAVSGIPGAQSAAVIVRNAGHPTCAASSDQLGGGVGALEVHLNEGPSVDVLRTGRRQVSSSLVTERRWPEFSNRALYSGIASAMSQPLPAHGSTFGALTVYSTRESAFAENSFGQAASLASQGAVVIANSNLYWQANELTDQLKEALDSRAVIDQAKGVLMAREHLSPDEAFALLLKASQTGNVKVRDIALQIVAEAQGLRSKGIVA